jgi:glutathione S-transferase
MKLYFSPGACSLAPHIAASELGINLDLEQVDIREKKTKAGKDYWTINPKGQVPMLELDNGERLTEVPVILQYMYDQKPSGDLSPAARTPDHYRMLEWLNFVTSEMHKTYAPMFRPTTPEEFKKLSREAISRKLDLLDKQLAGKQYLMGNKFTLADMYMFAILRWSPIVGVDLSKWPNVIAYANRVAARPKTAEALKAEGLQWPPKS